MMPIDFLIFLKGFCTGFFVCLLMPTSMIFIADYVIKLTWQKGILASFGIMTAHILWAGIAAFILYFTFKAFDPDENIFPLLGSIILFFMTLRTYRSREKYHYEGHIRRNPPMIFSSTFLFALSFPQSAIGYLAIFLVLIMFPFPPSIMETCLPTIGVFFGSLTYWLIFVFAIYQRGSIIPHKALQQIHRIAIFILIAFAMIGLLNLYF